jgi:hypothetical protein
MSAEHKKEKFGLIAIDVESTGKYIGGSYKGSDVVFAVGIASCALKGDKKIPEIKTSVVCLDLEKPPSDSWQDFWQYRNFEPRCWDEFWSFRTELLDQLQSDTKEFPLYCKAKFAEALNNALAEHEALYEKTDILTDTTSYDTVCVGTLLNQHDFEPLNYTRLGAYRGGVELDSFIAGIAGVSDPSDWESVEKFKTDHLEALKIVQVKHDHNPANDATHILVTYLAGIQYIKNQIYLRYKERQKGANP